MENTDLNILNINIVREGRTLGAYTDSGQLVADSTSQSTLWGMIKQYARKTGFGVVSSDGGATWIEVEQIVA